RSCGPPVPRREPGCRSRAQAVLAVMGAGTAREGPEWAYRGSRGGGRMEFRILGPFEILADDGELMPVPRRRERELLSVLFLFAGMPCGRELLARALWGESQPADPEAALRVCVCRARKVPGIAGSLAVLPAGYLADPGTVRIDVVRFRQLRARA